MSTKAIHKHATKLNKKDLPTTVPPDESDSESDSSASTDSLTIYEKSYIRPEMNESSSESATRTTEIEENVKRRKQHREEKRLRRLQKRQRRAKQQHKQYTITLTLDDLNPHSLYSNPDRPIGPQPLDVLYDSGASVTMFPLDHTDSWRNLRPSLHTISGCFTQDAPVTDFMVGEFHAQLTLDDGETVRLIFPESLAIPTTSANASLLSDTQFLLAGHSYVSDLRTPKLVFASGGDTQ
jgi:hypothetical protein